MSSTGRGRGNRNIGKYLMRMIFSVEFLVLVLVQSPLAKLLSQLGLAKQSRLLTMVSIILVYCIGSFVRRAMGLRSLFRD